MASTLVEKLYDQFDPDEFRDGYQERVMALIAAKARGEEPELPSEDAQAETPDLMAALEASLSGARG
jgi:DNA end-binding protein Ku